MRRRGIRSALIGVLAFAGLAGEAIQASPTEADETVADRLEAVDDFVAERMGALHIPGLALVLIDGGQIAYEHGYGVADTSGRAVTVHTPFMLASTSKQLTGIAVQQLVRAGTLDLDAPVSRYLAVFDSADEAHRSITIRQLLGHTSGFSAELSVANHIPGGPGETLEANARRLAGETLAHQPGSTFEYSDANYDLLGYMVEEVSGMPYAEYLQKHVLDPLGMHESYTNQADAERAGLADGYYPWFGVVSLPTSFACTESALPSSCVASSAHDLARVALAQLGDIPTGQADLDAELLAETRMSLSRENRAVEYASGWRVHRFWPVHTEGDPNDPTVPMMYEHSGNLPTYASFVAYVPERGFGVAITANADDKVVESRWTNFVFDTMRVAIGTDPRMAGPTEDLPRQFVRPLYALAILLQLVAAIWSLRSRRRRLAIGVAAAVNLGVLALMVAYPPITAGVSWLILLTAAPDLGLMTVLAFVVAVAWLVLLSIRPLLKRGRGVAFQSPGSA